MNLSPSAICEDGKVKITVPWEDLKIEVPMNFEDRKDIVLYNVIRELQREINKLKEQQLSKKLLIDNLSVSQAEAIIKKFLFTMRDSGKTRISMLNLIRNIPLPPEQIEEIMIKLENENKIKEI